MVERIFSRPNRVFKAGVALVLLFSIMIGILHVGVLFLFGLPILGLLVGYFLVWCGKADLKAKAIVTLLSIPIVCISLLLSFYVRTAEPETFLIPQNYRGEIVVYLDEECGQDPVYDNGRRLYIVPDTGILITKFGKNAGYLDRSFYFVDEGGERAVLALFRWQNFETEKEEWDKFGSAHFGELTKESVGAFWAYGSETYGHSRNSIGYQITNYGYFDLPDKERWASGRLFAESAGRLLENCREGKYLHSDSR